MYFYLFVSHAHSYPEQKGECCQREKVNPKCCTAAKKKKPRQTKYWYEDQSNQKVLKENNCEQ